MKKKVLVTGANGQLGMTFRELFDNSERFDFSFVSRSELNIADPKKLQSLFEKNKYDYCINCAAYTNVEQAEKTPEIAYAINSDAVKLLSEVCKDHDVILVHISTDYVFDGQKKQPYDVTDLPNPINEYGRSKLMGERYIQDLLDHYYIIRTSWLYSKSVGKNFYRTILQKIERREDLKITDAQLGCPTDCVNLANYIVNRILKQAPPFGVFHYCDDQPMTWFDFAKAIVEEHKAEDRVNLIPSNDYVTLAERPPYSVLKTTK